MTGPRVVAIGDSLALGVGDGVHGARGDCGWAALTAYALGASRFTNLARNGTRSLDMLADQVPAALRELPDVVLVSVGGNDVLRGDFSAEEMQRALSASLYLLGAPDRRIVLLRPDRIGLFDLTPRRIAHAMARRMSAANDALLRTAARAHVDTIDSATVVAALGTRAWHVDRIHPSPAGHRALADAATALLADRWPPVSPVPAAPAPPGHAAVAAWLVLNGVPWAVKRSRDLLPQVARAVTHELREERRIRRTGGRAVRA